MNSRDALNDLKNSEVLKVSPLCKDCEKANP